MDIAVLTMIAMTALFSATATVEMLPLPFAIAARHGWRSAWLGAAGALTALIAIGALSVTAVDFFPADSVRFIAAACVLGVGLQWLQGMVRYYARLAPLRYGAQSYRAALGALSSDDGSDGGLLAAWALRSTFLRGLTFVVIVVAIGEQQTASVPLAVGVATATALVTGTILAAIRFRGVERVDHGIRTLAAILMTSSGILWSRQDLGIARLDDQLGVVLFAALLIPLACALIIAGRSAALRST